MKTTILFALVFVQVAYSQVSVVTEWPQNDHIVGGAIVRMTYANLDEGSCVAQLPNMVRMFHVMNGHIVFGEDSSPAEGRYKMAAPADWEAVNGTFNVLILFDRDAIFNITDIVFTCDPTDVQDISVYSFPQNDLVQEASSNVHYRPGFHKGDVLTITLPVPVARFNFTTMDSEYTVESSDQMVFTLSGFKNVEGVDEMKEVHFSLNYDNSDGSGTNWFSAAEVSVTIQRVAEDV